MYFPIKIYIQVYLFNPYYLADNPLKHVKHVVGHVFSTPINQNCNCTDIYSRSYNPSWVTSAQSHLLVCITRNSGIFAHFNCLKIKYKNRKLKFFFSLLILDFFTSIGTVSVILVNVRSTTVPLKPLSDQQCGRYRRFSKFKIS